MASEQLTGSAAIEDYFTEQGYTNLALSQHWRHLVGTGDKDDTTYFIKMAATKLISPYTENESLWYNVLTQLPEHSLPVHFPTVSETGNFEDRFWYAAMHITGQALAHPEDSEQSLSDETIHVLAKTAHNFMQLALPEQITTIPYPLLNRESILEKVLGWQKDSGRDVGKLIEFMQERMPQLEFAPAHGDFVPEHVLKSDDSYYLIDLESARPDNIKFYDVAYCFHRLYTKYKQPELAEKFLKEFLNLQALSADDKRCLELALAQRLIGGYLDAKSDNLTSLELQEELESKLLKRQIIF